MVGTLKQCGHRRRVQVRRRLERRGQRNGNDVARVHGLGGDVRGVDLAGDLGFVEPYGHRRVDEGEAFLEGQLRRRRVGFGGEIYGGGEGGVGYRGSKRGTPKGAAGMVPGGVLRRRAARWLGSVTALGATDESR